MSQQTQLPRASVHVYPVRQFKSKEGRPFFVQQIEILQSPYRSNTTFNRNSKSAETALPPGPYTVAVAYRPGATAFDLPIPSFFDYQPLVQDAAWASHLAALSAALSIPAPAGAGSTSNSTTTPFAVSK